MSSPVPALSSALYAGQLRRELSERNREYARIQGLDHVLSYGDMPVIVYRESEDGAAHGNFHPRAWRAICADPAWRRRLGKVHTQARSSLPKNDRRWCELDASTSSDALLMNVFCYPGVCRADAVARMLGTSVAAAPQFGVRARVPLVGGKADRTEIDMRLGDLLVEAKLTETDFQAQRPELVESYRDFAEIFDRRSLPRRNGRYLGYQLIRNVLAAHAGGASFCVLLDARRPDLQEGWYSVLRCVRPADLRVRCKVLAWQELAAALPRPLARFLAEKYGITNLQAAI